MHINDERLGSVSALEIPKALIGYARGAGAAFDIGGGAADCEPQAALDWFEQERRTAAGEPDIAF
jgi:hypothetical protein